VTAGDRERLVQTVRAAGVEHYALIGPEMISHRLFERAKSFDVLIVLGGDGTARAVAKRAPPSGPPLLLLPGGTLNILPRALCGELAWPQALAAGLKRGVVRRLSAGRANGEPFYVAAFFGAPTLLARAREDVRDGRLLAAWRRFGTFLDRAFARSLRARPDNDLPQRAAAIGVLCPTFSGGVEADHLEWVRLDARHMLDLARVGLRALLRDWRRDPAIEIAECRRGDILSLGVIPATLDGEPRTFVSRVRVTFDASGPRVIAVTPES
jgi:diacylglycerol kinase family enzyme